MPKKVLGGLTDLGSSKKAQRGSESIQKVQEGVRRFKKGK